MIIITIPQKKKLQEFSYKPHMLVRVLKRCMKKKDIKLLLAVNALLLKLKNVSIGQNVTLTRYYETKKGTVDSNLNLFKKMDNIAVFIAGYDPSTKKIICGRYNEYQDVKFFALPHIQMIRKNKKLDSAKMKVWSRCE